LFEVDLAIGALVGPVRAAIGQARQRVIVLDVHFEFFIPAVEHVAPDALDQLFMVERRRGAHAVSR
jgi:hypothetical protein